jgi:hypothetical protein
MTQQQLNVLQTKYKENIPQIQEIIQTKSLEMMKLSDGMTATYRRNDPSPRVIFWSNEIT